MNRTLITSLAVAALAASPALAVETPQPGKADTRMRTIDYDPAQVVHVVGVYRSAIQILFADDETILNVAVGDSTAWDVAAKQNILFLKPKAAHGVTNLIVTTSRSDGPERNYTFELTTQARAKSASLYVLRFRYPSDLKAAASAALSAEEQALQAKLLALKLERGVVEGTRNLKYTVQGATTLQPSEVSDNGLFTVLRFPAGQPIPAVYEVTPDGTESLVPFDVRGEFVVIHDIAGQFRLRRGRDVLCIYNEGPPSYGADLGTNTASPEVDRTDKPGPKAPPKAPTGDRP